MKYIIAHLPGEKAVPILFAPFMAHKSIADRLGLPRAVIHSAGFCRIDGEARVDCAGFATSLMIGPAAGDAQLIAACIRHTNAEYPAKPYGEEEFGEPTDDSEWRDLQARFGTGSER